jgi:hypothetical protein
MRLLLVVAAMRHGGAERIVVQLADDAVQRGHAVTVASAGGPWVEQVRAAGADHAPVPLDRRSAAATLRAASRLAAVVRRFQPDVVHAHNVRATLAAAGGGGGRERRPPPGPGGGRRCSPPCMGWPRTTTPRPPACCGSLGAR